LKIARVQSRNFTAGKISVNGSSVFATIETRLCEELKLSAFGP